MCTVVYNCQDTDSEANNGINLGSVGIVSANSQEEGETTSIEGASQFTSLYQLSGPSFIKGFKERFDPYDSDKVFCNNQMKICYTLIYFLKIS